MGTPEFAVASLEALLASGSEIVGVVTAPDKPAGRGKVVTESPVKRYASGRGLRVLQPAKLKDETFLEELRSLGADLQVVVAFRMLPEVVWSMPPKGTINLHASLLPQYRGAAPINWVLINGEAESGVTTFFLKHEIDTGDILFTEKVTLTGVETAGELHDRLMYKGAGLLVKTVKAIESGRYTELPQAQLEEGVELKTAPKLFKENGEIDWNQPAEKIYNLVRGLSPSPAAYTTLQEKTLRVFKVEFENVETGEKPGEFFSDGKSYLKASAADGFVYFKEVQLEGKKRLEIEEFLRGVRL